MHIYSDIIDKMNELYGIFMHRDYNWANIGLSINVTIEMLIALKSSIGFKEQQFLN